MSSEYNKFPAAIVKSFRKFKSGFLHKYPNIDTVMAGGDLIARPVFEKFLFKSTVLAVTVPNTCKAKPGDHVFLGAIGVHGVALAYVDARIGDVLYIGSMSSELRS